MDGQVARIEHVQIAAPEGCEAAATDFYGAVPGLQEIVKPAALQARGGCWFECGAQQLHIGVERDFRPARKAHPAFAVFNLTNSAKLLIERGMSVLDDYNLPGERRIY